MNGQVLGGTSTALEGYYVVYRALVFEKKWEGLWTKLGDGWATCTGNGYQLAY